MIFFSIVNYFVRKFTYLLTYLFSNRYLQLPGTTKMHPLAPKLQLVVFLFSDSTYFLFTITEIVW